jgi:predicted tellurium resistance membrane protein TerC
MGFWLPLGEISWIDILLSGDNAVVIALARRSLPEGQHIDPDHRHGGRGNVA